MGRGTAIFLIVIGAILAFAVTAEISGIDIQTVGFILLVAGLGGLLWSFLRSATRLEPKLDLLAPPEPHRDEERPDPSALGELVGRARELAGQASTFLEAEGYTSERIDELAAEFVAGDHGTTRDEFITWALSQDHLTRAPVENGEPPRTVATADTEELP